MRLISRVDEPPGHPGRSVGDKTEEGEEGLIISPLFMSSFEDKNTDSSRKSAHEDQNCYKLSVWSLMYFFFLQIEYSNTNKSL